MFDSLTLTLGLSVLSATLAFTALFVRRPAAKATLGAVCTALALFCALVVRSAYAQSGGPDSLSDHLIVAGCYSVVIAVGIFNVIRGVKRLKA